MTKYLGCDKEECIRDWLEFKGDKDQEDIKKYKAGKLDFYPDYVLTHCECHCIYFLGKNGWSCAGCGVQYCDSCVGKKLKLLEYENMYCEDMYCEDCFENAKDSESE